MIDRVNREKMQPTPTMMQPLPQRVKFQLAAAVIWYVPIAVMWFAVAGWFWSPVIPVQGEGAPHVVLHQSIAAQTWREWLASAALFVTGQVIAMLVKAWSASARRTVALSRFLDVPFFGGHAFAAVLCVRACSNVWSDRASAFSAAVAASDGGADLAQHDGGDGVWQNTTKRAGNLALVNLNLAADSADVNNVYSFVCLFVGLVAGAINALHYLRREESVLAFPTVPRERYLRIARRWKPSILGAVTQAAWLCVVCFLCISSLVAVIAVYCDVAAGAGLLPTIARELASLASITFRPTGCAGSAANASAAAGAQECAADVAAQSSVHGRSALSLIVFGLAPRLIALVLPIGVTIAAAFRMGAGFVEVFLTSPLPEVQHYNREGVSAADDDEDLPALIDALRIAVPHSAEADMKAFDAHSGASAAAASGFSGALRGSMRRSVARWEAEVTHHERRFQSAAQSQLVERSPDVTPPAAGSFRKRSRHLEWSLDVSRAQALLSLRDAALHRVGLRDAIYSDLATWLVIARACTAVIDAMTLQVRRACVCCGSTFFLRRSIRPFSLSPPPSPLHFRTAAPRCESSRRAPRAGDAAPAGRKPWRRRCRSQLSPRRGRRHERNQLHNERARRHGKRCRAALPGAALPTVLLLRSRAALPAAPAPTQADSLARRRARNILLSRRLPRAGARQQRVVQDPDALRGCAGGDVGGGRREHARGARDGRGAPRRSPRRCSRRAHLSRRCYCCGGEVSKSRPRSEQSRPRRRRYLRSRRACAFWLGCDGREASQREALAEWPRA